MRIALIHHRLTRNGGLETRLTNYMRSFASKGHDVTVITGQRDRRIPVPEGVEVHVLRNFFTRKKYRRLIFEKNVERYMSKHSFDFSLSLERTSSQDAVLAPSNHLGFLAAMGREDITAWDQMEIDMDRRAFERSKVIFAASGMMKEELIRYYQIPEEKIHILFPPLDTDRFTSSLKQQKALLKKKFAMTEGKFHLVFVSTSHRRKGLPLLLEVFKELEKEKEPYELYISGKGRIPGALPGNVRSLGYVEDTPALFAAADFSVLPARYEPFGQVVSESVACGTPVLISDRVGAGEIIRPDEGQILPAEDVAAWVQAIEGLFDHRFAPHPDFASVHHLSVDEHVERILELI